MPQIVEGDIFAMKTGVSETAKGLATKETVVTFPIWLRRRGGCVVKHVAKLVNVQLVLWRIVLHGVIEGGDQLSGSILVSVCAS